MITFLQGTLEDALPTQVVVNVGGVGYQAAIPLSSFDRLPAPGQPVKLLPYLQVRADAHVLFGFMTAPERGLLLLLLTPGGGIGPKTALGVLSGMSVENFKNAVVNNDVASLSKVKGLGKKTAERITLELRDKLGVAATWEVASRAHAPSAEESAINDAVLALIALGYKQVDAHKAVRGVFKPGPNDAAPTADDLLRGALKALA